MKNMDMQSWEGAFIFRWKYILGLSMLDERTSGQPTLPDQLRRQMLSANNYRLWGGRNLAMFQHFKLCYEIFKAIVTAVREVISG